MVALCRARFGASLLAVMTGEQRLSFFSKCTRGKDGWHAVKPFGKLS
jgi:hypothetical protein